MRYDGERKLKKCSNDACPTSIRDLFFRYPFSMWREIDHKSPNARVTTLPRSLWHVFRIPTHVQRYWEKILVSRYCPPQWFPLYWSTLLVLLILPNPDACWKNLRHLWNTVSPLVPLPFVVSLYWSSSLTPFTCPLHWSPLLNPYARWMTSSARLLNPDARWTRSAARVVNPDAQWMTSASAF